MATIIVPLATGPRTKEVICLANELVREGVNPDDALVQADAMVDELHAYAEEWDTTVANQREEHPMTLFTPERVHVRNYLSVEVLKLLERTGYSAEVEAAAPTMWRAAKFLIEDGDPKLRCLGFEALMDAINQAPDALDKAGDQYLFELERGKRVVIYTRTATLNDDALAAQERACREYAEARAWNIIAVYADPASSGTQDTRPGLQRLLKDVQDGDIQTVLVASADRLARSAHLDETIMEELDKHGTTVKIVR